MERKGIYKTNKFPQRMCEVFNQEKGLLTDKSLCLGAAEDGTIFIDINKIDHSKLKKLQPGEFAKCRILAVDDYDMIGEII